MVQPSDVHRSKDTKLTRRRILRTLTAAGVTPVAASRITVDDVKAADDDQVPISLDVKGEIKKNVPADWYDKLIHTRDIRSKLSRNHDHRESVLGVGYSPGKRGGENPYIIVELNEDSDSKEQDKSEIPDEREGVTIEKEEVKAASPDNCPDTPYYESLCDNYDCTTLPEGDDIPAGPMVEFPGIGRWGSHTSQVLWSDDTLKLGWMTSAHYITDCGVGHEAYHQPANDGGDGYKIGEITAIHPEYDISIIETTEFDNPNIDPSPYVHESSNLSSGYTYGPIETVMTKDGVDLWAREDREVFRYGAGTCYGNGRVEATIQDWEVLGEPEDWCNPSINEVVRIRIDNSGDGDSGALHWGYYEPQDAYLGIGSHSASRPSPSIFSDRDRVAFCSAGYRIYNDLGYFWSQ